MNKGMGFSRTIKLDWLDAAAALVLETRDAADIRRRLVPVIENDVNGEDAQRKTLDVLTAIWVKTGETIPALHGAAADLFRDSAIPAERLWIHYGLALAYYPLFRLCTRAIGQSARLQQTVTRSQVKERVAYEMGHYGALDRSVERIMASMFDWAVLLPAEEKHTYLPAVNTFPATRQELELWLLACALQAYHAETLAADDLLHLPELFPFQITVGRDHLRASRWFEVSRQGGGLDMVRKAEKIH